MSYGLLHNSRLGAVLSLCIVDKSSANGEDGATRIRPNPATRFFTDNVQHGLCIYLEDARPPTIRKYDTRFFLEK